jgi:hypothetical protein
MYKIGEIFYFDDKYTDRVDFCNENNLTIIEIAPDEKGRRFTIKEIPEPTEDDIIEILRSRREYECFSIVNRGVLWYNTLTEQQRIELNNWYLAWLDVTETKIIPQKPEWLK